MSIDATKLVESILNEGEGYRRVGIAKTKPRGRDGRRDVYGIYSSGDEAYGYKIEPTLYAKYEGYDLPDGTMVGLALAGPNAAHSQPMIDFKEGNYDEVKFFDKKESVDEAGNEPRELDLSSAELDFIDGLGLRVDRLTPVKNKQQAKSLLDLIRNATDIDAPAAGDARQLVARDLIKKLLSYINKFESIKETQARMLIDNLGDADPISYGGYFIYDDGSAELLDVPENEDGEYIVYRFDISPIDPDGEWFGKDLKSVASYIGANTEEELRQAFQSEDPKERAWAYRAVGEYYGFANFDWYPLTLTKKEAEARYGYESEDDDIDEPEVDDTEVGDDEVEESKQNEALDDEWEMGKAPVKGQLVLKSSEYVCIKSWFEGHGFPEMQPIMKIIKGAVKEGNTYTFNIPNDGYYTGKNFVKEAINELERSQANIRGSAQKICSNIIEKLYDLLDSNESINRGHHMKDTSEVTCTTSIAKRLINKKLKKKNYDVVEFVNSIYETGDIDLPLEPDETGQRSDKTLLSLFPESMFAGWTKDSYDEAHIKYTHPENPQTYIEIFEGTPQDEYDEFDFDSMMGDEEPVDGGSEQPVVGESIGEMASFTRTGTLSLTAKDKAVIKAFTDKKSAESKDLSTDGSILERSGRKILYWSDDKIWVDTGNHTKSSQTINNYAKKTCAANEWGGYEGRNKTESIEAVKAYVLMMDTEYGKLYWTGSKWSNNHKDSKIYASENDAEEAEKELKPEDITGQVTIEPEVGEEEPTDDLGMGSVDTDLDAADYVESIIEGDDEDTDETGASELRLYIDNDGDLYRQQTVPIYKNLINKKARGIYDSNLAVKLFMYLVDAGAKKYDKEFGSGGGEWNKVFPKSTRLAVARELVQHFETEAELGNYDQYLAKKYQKGKKQESITEKKYVKRGIASLAMSGKRGSFIDTPEDMQWLKDVHIPELDLATAKSAMIYGNEDYPEQIEVYQDESPNVDDWPDVYVLEDDEVDESITEDYIPVEGGIGRYHVTRVEPYLKDPRGNSVVCYGHNEKYCDASGCSGEERELGICRGDVKVGSLVDRFEDATLELVNESRRNETIVDTADELEDDAVSSGPFTVIVQWSKLYDVPQEALNDVTDGEDASTFKFSGTFATIEELEKNVPIISSMLASIPVTIEYADQGADVTVQTDDQSQMTPVEAVYRRIAQFLGEDEGSFKTGDRVEISKSYPSKKLVGARGTIVKQVPGNEPRYSVSFDTMDEKVLTFPEKYLKKLSEVGESISETDSADNPQDVTATDDEPIDGTKPSDAEAKSNKKSVKAYIAELAKLGANADSIDAITRATQAIQEGTGPDALNELSDAVMAEAIKLVGDVGSEKLMSFISALQTAATYKPGNANSSEATGTIIKEGTDEANLFKSMLGVKPGKLIWDSKLNKYMLVDKESGQAVEQAGSDLHYANKLAKSLGYYVNPKDIGKGSITGVRSYQAESTEDEDMKRNKLNEARKIIAYVDRKSGKPYKYLSQSGKLTTNPANAQQFDGQVPSERVDYAKGLLGLGKPSDYDVKVVEAPEVIIERSPSAAELIDRILSEK
jgi:hypothetical protein